MFNAIIRSAVLISVLSLFGGCGNSTGDTDSERADSLLLQAKQFFSVGNDSMSLVMLDSLDHSAAKAINQRKEARLLRPQVVERMAMTRLSEADSMMVVNQIKGEHLRNELEFVSGTGVEGYYVGRGTRSVDVRSVAGLHSRVSPDYHFYLIASSPQPIGSVSVELISGNESVRSVPVGFDGERNTRNSACETITFTEAESHPIGEFVARHANDPIKIIFIGESGRNASMDLNDIQKKAILSTFGLIDAVNADRYYRLEKDRLTRQVEIARKQLANVAAKE